MIKTIISFWRKTRKMNEKMKKRIRKVLSTISLSFAFVLSITQIAFAEGENQSLAEISPDDPSLKIICVVAVILGIFAGYKMKNK